MIPIAGKQNHFRTLLPHFIQFPALSLRLLCRTDPDRVTDCIIPDRERPPEWPQYAIKQDDSGIFLGTLFTKMHKNKKFLCEYYEKLIFLHFLH